MTVQLPEEGLAKTILPELDRKTRRSEPSGKRFPWGKIASYVVLVAFSVLYLAPLFMLVNSSFKPLSDFFRDPVALASSLNFDNYTKAWELANFPRYMLNSLFYTAVATAIFVATTLFVAFPISRGLIRGGPAILTLYVVALFLPPALIPQFQLILFLDLYNTRPGFIMLFLVNAIGMIIVVNYIKSIPKELDESAAVDGCGYFRFVWSIILPLIRPAIATVTVLHAIGIWNDIVMPTIYLTDSNLYPITRGLIAFEGQYGSDWPALAAAVLMLMLPMLILFMFLQRYIIGGLTSGAVKG
ncbi:MAG TPA: carbohydrate ABC transporter permease [Acidimicrobiia bacterium]|jgi:raffinose/stachyose/melibiose transport system permease protein|nr:carbohydrate ABC transporter permease [Acidimicrobiia bacterium]